MLLMAWLKNAIIAIITTMARMLWTKARPRTATTEATTAAIRMMTLGTATVAMATAAIATRVTRPTGVQGDEDRWRPLVVD